MCIPIKSPLYHHWLGFFISHFVHVHLGFKSLVYQRFLTYSQNVSRWWIFPFLIPMILPPWLGILDYSHGFPPTFPSHHESFVLLMALHSAEWADGIIEDVSKNCAWRRRSFRRKKGIRDGKWGYSHDMEMLNNFMGLWTPLKTCYVFFVHGILSILWW